MTLSLFISWEAASFFAYRIGTAWGESGNELLKISHGFSVRLIFFCSICLWNKYYKTMYVFAFNLNKTLTAHHFNTSAGGKTGTFVFWRSLFQSEWEGVKTLRHPGFWEKTHFCSTSYAAMETATALEGWNGAGFNSFSGGVVFPPFLWLRERFTECGTSEQGAVLSLAPLCARNIPSICTCCYIFFLI